MPLNAEEVAASQRGILSIVGLLEREEYANLMKKRFVPRIFDSDLLENTITTAPPALVPLVWIPIAFGHYYGAATLPKFVACALFAVGIILWGAIEYALHRFVFHMTPNGYWTRTIHFALHGLHHVSPSDSNRLVFPLPLSLPFYLAFGRGLFAVCSSSVAHMLLCGAIWGYMSYDMLHWYVHHPRCVLRFWKRCHQVHHYKNSDCNFGVSPPGKLFDFVFGTHQL